MKAMYLGYPKSQITKLKLPNKTELNIITLDSRLPSQKCAKQLSVNCAGDERGQTHKLLITHLQAYIRLITESHLDLSEFWQKYPTKITWMT